MEVNKDFGMKDMMIRIERRSFRYYVAAVALTFMCCFKKLFKCDARNFRKQFKSFKNESNEVILFFQFNKNNLFWRHCNFSVNTALQTKQSYQQHDNNFLFLIVFIISILFKRTKEEVLKSIKKKLSTSKMHTAAVFLTIH